MYNDCGTQTKPKNEPKHVLTLAVQNLVRRALSPTYTKNEFVTLTIDSTHCCPPWNTKKVRVNRAHKAEFAFAYYHDVCCCCLFLIIYFPSSETKLLLLIN
jgi:hypothetical protein